MCRRFTERQVRAGGAAGHPQPRFGWFSKGDLAVAVPVSPPGPPPPAERFPARGGCSPRPRGRPQAPAPGGGSPFSSAGEVKPKAGPAGACPFKLKLTTGLGTRRGRGKPGAAPPAQPFPSQLRRTPRHPTMHSGLPAGEGSRLLPHASQSQLRPAGLHSPACAAARQCLCGDWRRRRGGVCVLPVRSAVFPPVAKCRAVRPEPGLAAAASGERPPWAAGGDPPPRLASLFSSPRRPGR